MIIQTLKNFIQLGFSCQLCGIDQQQNHRLCQDCWSMLPRPQSNIIVRQNREIHVCYDYCFPFDRIIHLYKYEQKLHFQHLLSHSLVQLKLKRLKAIVPMPISSERLAYRGYNQMLIIANLLSKQLKIPVWQPVIRSAQHSQKGLTRSERIENIEDQFIPTFSERKKYRQVLIIDDVVTTGSSVHALALALERLGCEKIQIACLAAAQV